MNVINFRCQNYLEKCERSAKIRRTDRNYGPFGCWCVLLSCSITPQSCDSQSSYIFLGKSTLLNILSGYKASKIDGLITMNGKERNLSVFRKLSAYIMQDNQLHLNLTVEEAMNVAANLKLSQKVRSDEKWNVVGFFVVSRPNLIPRSNHAILHSCVIR